MTLCLHTYLGTTTENVFKNVSFSLFQLMRLCVHLNNYDCLVAREVVVSQAYFVSGLHIFRKTIQSHAYKVNVTLALTKQLPMLARNKSIKSFVQLKYQHLLLQTVSCSND